METWKKRYRKTCSSLADHSLCYSVCGAEHEFRGDFIYFLFREDSPFIFNLGITRPGVLAGII